MDNDALERKLRDLYSSGDMEGLMGLMSDMAAPDMVQEWPQSGERIRGRDNIAAVNQNYEGATGTAPKMTLRRILKPGSAWVVEATIDYGDGTPVSMVSIIETNAEGKIVKETDYFANPFPAPEWRRKWVEQVEPISVG